MAERMHADEWAKWSIYVASTKEDVATSFFGLREVFREAERARDEAAWLRAALRHMDDCPRCKFRGIAFCAQRPLGALEGVP